MLMGDRVIVLRDSDESQCSQTLMGAPSGVRDGDVLTCEKTNIDDVITFVPGHMMLGDPSSSLSALGPFLSMVADQEHAMAHSGSGKDSVLDLDCMTAGEHAHRSTCLFHSPTSLDRHLSVALLVNADFFANAITMTSSPLAGIVLRNVVTRLDDGGADRRRVLLHGQ